MPEFYQIGGFGGHTQGWFGWDERKLAKVVFEALADHETSTLQLLLGILTNGASYLLVTPVQMERLKRHAHQRPFYSRDLIPSSTYVSLTPITFYNIESLAKKLKTYAQSTKASVKRRPPRDTSQANKSYILSGNLAQSPRPAFEHQRLFWMALHNDLDFGIYCLSEHWDRDEVVVLSLSMQTWQADERSIEDIRSSPKILNVGWSVFHISALVDGSYGTSFESTNFLIKENAALRNKGMVVKESRYGPTEKVEQAVAAQRLTEIFKTQRSEPMLLLVHDQITSLSVLSALGIDRSSWQYGIEGLLGLDLNQQDAQHRSSPNRGNAGQRYSTGLNDNGLRRSLSPPRQGEYNPNIRPREDPRISCRKGRLSPSHETPTRKQGPRPGVYVVDVQQLFQTLTGAGFGSSLVRIASELGLDIDLGSMCAGNDCRVIVEAWRVMASGNSIDEQHLQLGSRPQASNTGGSGLSLASSSTAVQGGQSVDADSDVDVNDIPVRRSMLQDIYDASDDDDY